MTQSAISKIHPYTDEVKQVIQNVENANEVLREYSYELVTTDPEAAERLSVDILNKLEDAGQKMESLRPPPEADRVHTLLKRSVRAFATSMPSMMMATRENDVPLAQKAVSDHHEAVSYLSETGKALDRLHERILASKRAHGIE
jgi:hypothetical protein